MIVFTTATFESAHFLPNVPDGHKCRHLHGHSYRLEIHVRGEIDPVTGWVLDYTDIRDVFEPLRQALDHHCLNDIDGLGNPTCENLARWLWQRLRPQLPLHELRIHETAASGCIYQGEDPP